MGYSMGFQWQLSTLGGFHDDLHVFNSNLGEPFPPNLTTMGVLGAKEETESHVR